MPNSQYPFNSMQYLGQQIQHQTQSANDSLSYSQQATAATHTDLASKINSLLEMFNQAVELIKKLADGLNSLVNLSHDIARSRKALSETHSKLTNPLNAISAPLWLESQAQSWTEQIVVPLNEIAQQINTQASQDQQYWHGLASENYQLAIKQEPADLTKLAHIATQLANLLKQTGQQGKNYYKALLASLIAIASFCAQIAVLCSNPITILGASVVIINGLLPTLTTINNAENEFANTLQSQLQQHKTIQNQLESLLKTQNGNWKQLTR